MTQTLTTEAMQEIYEAAVHVEATLGDPDAEFDLYCKLDDVGGVDVTIRKLIDMVRAANREAQPAGFYTTVSGRGGVVWHNGAPEDDTAIYTAPPAPAVPEAISTRQAIANMERHELCGSINVAYKHGWNDFRAAILAQPVSQGYKRVPVEPTEEMIAAAMNCDDVEFNSDETFCVNFDNIYRAMLAAAPEGVK